VLPPPQPTHDEAAALRAFEAAHKEFARGRFAEARNQFRSLVENFSTVAEVTARARTYLAVAEARLRTELALPKDADSLYDRGVIELNRGEYVAAQELFERALRREPEAAHIHYGLAASRARLERSIQPSSPYAAPSISNLHCESARNAIRILILCAAIPSSIN